MQSIRPLLLACGMLALLLAESPLLAAPPSPPADPLEELQRWLTQEKIEFDEAAMSFAQKLMDAGCKPDDALRWTRLALFADESWNLAELSGVIEEQLLAGATRQVVEAEVEKRIAARAKELRVDLSGFGSSAGAAGGKGKPPAPAKGAAGAKAGK